MLRSGFKFALLFSFAGALCGAEAAPTPGPPRFERHAFSLPQNIWGVDAIDLNGDGRLELVALGYTQVFALLAPVWQPRVIFDSGGGRFLHCIAVDWDRDGDLDLAVGSFSQGLVLWFENMGGGRFTRQVIDDAHAQQSYDLKIADIDGDGRPDVLIAGRQSKNVVWYRQR